MKKKFTIRIVTEMETGLITRIAAMFKRRNMEIESMFLSEADAFRMREFVIEIKASEEELRRFALQLEKQIGVFSAVFYPRINSTQQEVMLRSLSLVELNAEMYVRSLLQKRQMALEKFQSGGKNTRTFSEHKQNSNQQL